MNYKRILAAGLITTMMFPAANIALANDEAGFSSAPESSSVCTEMTDSGSSTPDACGDSDAAVSDNQSENAASDAENSDNVLDSSQEADSSTDDFTSQETTSNDKEHPSEEDASSKENQDDSSLNNGEPNSESVSNPDSSENQNESEEESTASDSKQEFSESAKKELETPVQYEVGQLVTLPDGSNFYREGYKFVGWNSDPDATEGFFEILMEENTVLYAIWIPDAANSSESVSSQDHLVTEDRAETNEPAGEAEAPKVLDPAEPVKSNEDDFTEESTD